MAFSVLIVDDELDIQSSLSFALKDEGYEVFTASSPREALNLLKEKTIDVALYDVWFPDGDGLELLKASKDDHADMIPVMMSGHGNIELAIKAIRMGAYDFLEKPLELDKVLLVLKNALETKKLKEENIRLSHQILYKAKLIGESSAVLQLKNALYKAALANSPIMLVGENGTGKELCARLLHQLSARRDSSYHVLNCGALKREELEVELYGAEKGTAFSKTQRKIGKLEQAQGGTLFLDEITYLPESLQTKLAQTLKDKRFHRLGSEHLQDLDVKLVTGSRKNIAQWVKENRFSNDLFYHLSVISIGVPSLKDRIGDLAALIEHFLENLSHDYVHKKPVISDELVSWMRSYDWPGNVRELKNLLERMVIMNPDKETLTLSDLPEELQNLSSQPLREGSFEDLPDPGGSLRQLRAQFEKSILSRRLDRLSGNVTKTAESLGLERAHLHRKLKQYGIQANRGEETAG
jgi:two-component system nitrogen regulation response regulator NtrX